MGAPSGAPSPSGVTLIGDIRDARCVFCNELVWDVAWELHEMSPDKWEVVCMPCEEATEIWSGK